MIDFTNFSLKLWDRFFQRKLDGMSLIILLFTQKIFSSDIISYSTMLLYNKLQALQ